MHDLHSVLRHHACGGEGHAERCRGQGPSATGVIQYIAEVVPWPHGAERAGESVSGQKSVHVDEQWGC